MRSRGRKNNFGKGFLWGVVVAVLYYAWPMVSEYIQPNLQKLVTNSELGKREFRSNISEVMGNKTKIAAYLMHDDTNPIVDVNFIFKNAGFASENEDEQGIARMTEMLLGEGAGEYSAEAMKEELETRGIKISFAAGKDDFVGNMMTTKENLPQAVRLLNLMLTKPRFEKDDIARIQKQVFDALKRQKEMPATELGRAFAKEVFGKHPYSRNSYGSKETVAKISKKQLQTFVKDNLISQNLFVGIAGDVSEAEAAQVIDGMFAGLPEKGRINFVMDADVKYDGRNKRIHKDISQNIVMKAVRGVSRTDDDFYPLFVANHIFGGSGLTSRLSQKIREEKGLTYSIYSYMVMDDKAPRVEVMFAVTPDKYAKANALFTKEWNDFAKNGISEKELTKAKDNLLASHNLRFASISDIAEMLAVMQKYNLGLDFLQKRNDYIRQIQIDDVNRVIKKYFVPQVIGVEIGIF